ncbi:MAG: beta-propeller fold lactonase family protein [Planctomycetes bacterium]|nr:beta-propeller fold lactonase family protein [Planctomycetota bacterium]
MKFHTQSHNLGRWPVVCDRLRPRGQATRCAVGFGLVILGLCSHNAPGQSDTAAVFVANNVSDEITSFTIDAKGVLSFVGTYFSSDGPQSMDISPGGRHIVVGHGTANDEIEVVTIFEVNPDASLSLVLSTFVPNSPLDAVWVDENIVAITETGSPSSVHTYWFDSDKAALTEVDSQSTGSFNTHLVVHPSLRLLYSQDTSQKMIRWFDVAKDGTMSVAGSIATGKVFPIDPVITPNGLNMYAAGGISNGGHRVLGFQIAKDGSLTQSGGSPFFSPGQSPAYLTVSKDDAYLFVGHGTDATVRSFAIDERDGSITSTGFVFDVGLQGTIGDLEVLGEYLLITDESTAIDGIAGLYSFQINPNGSFTMIGSINDTDGVRPESIVVWDPPANIPGDLDGDGTVGVKDLLILLGSWGPCADCNECPADIDGDCAVGVKDLLILLGNWG